MSLPASQAANAASSSSSSTSSQQHRPQPAKVDDVVARLSDTKLDITKRMSAAYELREFAEHYQQQDYMGFIKLFIPAFISAFASVQPSFKSDAPEHRTRHTLLETLRRVPNFEPVRRYAKQLMPVLLAIVKEDNEENGEVTMKILSDMLRSGKEECEEFAMPFFELIQGLFVSMKKTVDGFFGPARPGTEGSDSPAPNAASSPAAEGGEAPTSSQPPSSVSTSKTLASTHGGFKILAECPIAVVLVLQTYSSIMRPALNGFIPVIFDNCLLVQAQPQREAHEAAKARGDIFVGVAPGIRNRVAYSEMIQAQIKTMSFLAYVIKSGLPAIKDYATILPGVSMRLLQDCPSEAAGARKELLVAVRHILGTELRVHFAACIDTLLDDRVLLGTGITSREMHRPLAISMLADLIHHSRADLSAKQLAHIVQLHGKILHDPSLAPAIQTMCAKLLLNLVEAIITNDPEGTNRLLRQILDAFIEKMKNLPRLKSDWEVNRKRRDAQAKAAEEDATIEPLVDAVAIERSQPIQGAHMLLDHRESDVLKDTLFLLRNLFTGFKTILALLKRRGAPEPDADTFSTLFRAGLDCWSMIDFREQNQEKEMMDLFIPIFYDLSPPTFHEVFTTNLPFLYEQMLNNNALMGVPQNLLSMQSTSRRFVGIVLRFLADRLDDLGDADRKNATVTLRLFKLAFMAVTIYPEENEQMLQPHLGYFIMHSMKLAAKATEPSNYFLLLRALFRSIGGGKFELLYKDVLPLLPVMLEQLHNFMDAAESPQRETFVDLCLTVPVRLSALLPYLGFLMKPLVLALRSSGDLLSQGLRTLELCIDNLTQEFLDPIMAAYQVDIMNALWEHLQPLPHPHAHSHTTMRILGKMGGRNRRVLQQPPKIKWQSPKDAGSLTVFFAGYGNETTVVGDAAASSSQSMSLRPIVELACAHIRRGDKYYRQHSWELLKHAAALYLDGTLTYTQLPKEAMFERVVQGLFEATRVDEHSEEAIKYVLDVSKHIFALESQRFSADPSPKELLAAGLLPLTNAFFSGIAESMSSIINDAADLTAYTKLVLDIVKATREAMRGEASRPDAAVWLYLIKRFSSRLCGLCYDKLWAKKSGGWSGVNALVRDAELPVTWLRDNRLEIVRALVFMLKDMPTDPPRNADAVGETLLFVLRTANESSDANAGSDAAQSDEEREQLARQLENQQSLLTGALVGELSSSNPIVRAVTRDAFKLLAEFRGQTITEILTPVKDRLLGPIFQKPLRALPFGMQIGHIDAITFCLNLEPPLPAFNEELFRVLTEACALADADDAALVGRNSSQYKNTIAVTNLRIVAIKLLASALDRPEFQGPRHQDQRLRIIAMYFKSLYSRSDEVVQVAFDSLRESLKDSHRLPKDVLRSGLSPILQTLADPSKLTVVGLDGLARLLKLLTTYFKVEIGSKLLSHMQHISQNVVLEKASEGDLDPPKWADAHHLLHSKMPRDSDVIETLCAIVRVFPLLPAAAVQFMDQLVTTVIEIESTLRRSGATPFTAPLSTYLDKYAEPACEYFANKLNDARYARCFRLCVAEPGAEALRAELTKKRDKVIIPLLSEHQPQSACTALQLIQALVAREGNWLVDNADVFTAVKQYWQTPGCKQRRRDETNASPKCELSLLLDVFQAYLRRSDDVEAYFDLLDGFTYPSCVDMTPLLRFCYEQLAIKASVEFKQKIIARWIEVFESKELRQEYKSQALRVLVNPILFATARPSKKSGGEAEDGENDEKKEGEEPKADGDDTKMADADVKSAATPNLFDADLFSSVVNRVWKPFQSKAGFQLCSDDGHRVELLHMSTLTLEHCVDLLISQGGNRRETIKFGWAHIASEDATVKNAAYVFISRFLEYCDSPMKIVGQVYTGMLRSEKPEGRALLRRALDILVPALPTRVQAPTDGGPPLWVKWTKSLLATETHSSAVLMNILNLLVRHADQFYPYRDSFVPHVPACLARFGSGQTLEQKLLAIDVVDLLVRWEKKRVAAVAEREKEKEKESSAAEGDAMDVDAEPAAAADPPATRNTRKRAAAAAAATSDGDEDVGKDSKASTSEAPTTRKKVRLDDGSASASAVGVADQHAYSVPKHVRESLVTFLLRSICFSTDSMNRGPVGRAFFTYREIAAMGFWNICDIKLNIFQRPLMTADLSGDIEPFGNAFNIVCNSLQALRVICKEKSDAWFVAHAPQLCKLLEKAVRMKQPIVIELTRSILERVFEAVPDIQPEDKDAEGEEDDDDGTTPATTAPAEPKPAETKSSTQHEPEEVPSIVRSFGDKAIQDGFTDMKNAYAAFVVLGAWSKSKPERIDAYLSPLIKALSRFTKDHLAQQQSQNPQYQYGQGGGAMKSYSGVDAHVKLLLMALDLTKTRISHLGDQRRWWLSAAVQLGEKSSSIEVCRFLLTTLSKWVLEGKEQFPTVKEKAGLLVKMITFENREDDELLKEYLELIYSIYTSPQLARTELTVKLEPAFLLGCRHSDPTLRQKFLDVFDRTLIKAVPGRLQYLLGQQSWEHMAEHYWITQVLDLLLGSIDGDKPLVPTTPSLPSRHNGFVHQMKAMTTGGFVKALRGLIYASKDSAHDIFVDVFRASWASLPRKYQLDVTRSLIAILTRDYHLRQVTRRPNVVQTLLDGAQACRPQPELPPHVVKYLGKTFQAWHTSIDLLQNLLDTLPREDDSIREATLDAQAEMFAELAEEDAFYGLWRRRCVYAESNSAIAFEQSGMWAKAQVAYENAQMKARSGVLTFTEAEYSLWEDHWVICAQKLQQWEILTDLAKLEGNHDLLLECAWRLSDWLQEKDYLEQALDSLSAVPTPRRRVFAAFMALLKQQDVRSPSDFGIICDEAIQLSLRKWHSLPSVVTQAHVPLLQIFQQFVELQEASTIFTSLAQTNATNIDQRSTDLKTLMQTWRERLPNLCDDINAWSDLVAWRQHVFSAVNKAYLPLVPHLQQNGAQGSSTNSYAYRGYHETAWIINRFAHVARKHHLNDVCISSLTKIYTLPNIEIQEAFLKLREQAKCHYQNPAELGQGLEVINNTNLMFFAAPQKAEFFTLKGMFMEKLGLSEDANHAFATAIQMDLGLAKAWIEWGRYNERMLRSDPTNGFYAGSATSCYLQAASLYKNSKARKVLVRVLWLLGAESSQQAAIAAFETFRADQPTWYWITFIPQLLAALNHREAIIAKRILTSIAKTFPQSLYYSVRTTREEYTILRRNLAAHRAYQARQQMERAQAAQRAAAAAAAAATSQQQQQQSAGDDKAGNGTPKQEAGEAASGSTGAESKAGEAAQTPSKQSGGGDDKMDTDAKPAESQSGNGAPQSQQDDKDKAPGANASTNATQATSSPASTAPPPPGQAQAQAQAQAQVQAQAQAQSNAPNAAGPGTPSNNNEAAPQPWDHVDSVINNLKTAFPLLALTMENMAEQIIQRFKASAEEDLHRLMNALLSEALQQYITRASMPDDDGSLPTPTRQNLHRFSQNLAASPLRDSFEEDFINAPNLTLREAIKRLAQWRDRYEMAIDRRPQRYPLEHSSHFLCEFQHLKFDEVEVPGQYLEHHDNNSDFVRIARVSNTFEITRSSGACTRRLSMLSNKGVVHMFQVSLNTPRHCRREEKTMQLFRCLNGVLERRIQTRRRGLFFETPIAVPLTTHARLMSTSAGVVSLYDVWEEHCRTVGQGKEDPIHLWVEKLKSLGWSSQRTLAEQSNVRTELLEEIVAKLCPDTVLSDYMAKSMRTPQDLWLCRKQFTLSMAANSLLSYCFFIGSRLPSRYHIARDTGVVHQSDLLPAFNSNSPLKSHDAVPFRLSPSMQTFIGAGLIEGAFIAGLSTMGRALTEHTGKLHELLGLFVRDDLPRDTPVALVDKTCQEIIKRMTLMAGGPQTGAAAAPASAAPGNNAAGPDAPANALNNQLTIDLTNSATSIAKLALNEPLWMPWL